MPFADDAGIHSLHETGHSSAGKSKSRKERWQCNLDVNVREAFLLIRGRISKSSRPASGDQSKQQRELRIDFIGLGQTKLMAMGAVSAF